MDEKELKAQYGDLQILAENLAARQKQIEQRKLVIRVELNKLKNESPDTSGQSVESPPDSGEVEERV